LGDEENQAIRQGEAVNLYALPANVLALLYLAIVSLLAVILTFRDKNAAKKNVWRVKERTLFIVAALGGSVAMFLTMLAIRHKTRHKKFMIGIPLILALQVASIVLAFDSRLTVSRYEVESDKVNGQVTFALVTDLHSCSYGDGQEELLKAINAESPDAVLLCGDIFDDGLPPDNAEQFVGGVSAQYPCYYVSGNHEFWSGIADDFKAIIESYGVTVLAGTTEIMEASCQKEFHALNKLCLF
jgi:uncharacterized membrane protein YsdA (DUF1294 family)